MDNENFWEEKHLRDDLDAANKEVELLKKQNKILIDALTEMADATTLLAQEALTKMEAIREPK